MTDKKIAGELSAPPQNDRSMRRAWAIAVMIMLLGLVNWADKAVLGLVALPMMKDLGLSPSQFGLLGSAIFFLFAIAAAGAGFLADRFSTKWLLVIMVAVWGGSQLMIWVAPVFVVALISRTVLGLGEGPSAGLSFHTLGKWFRDHERNVPFSLQAVGSFAGIAVAPVVAMVIAAFSWRWAFFAVGILSVAWIVLWLFIGKEGPLGASTPRQPNAVQTSPAHRVPYRRLYFSRSFVGICAVGLSVYWSLSLIAAWVPASLETVQLYTPQQAANVVLGIGLAAMAFLVLYGLSSEVLMRRGVSTRVARALVGSLAVVAGGVIFAISVPMAAGPLQVVMFCAGLGLAMLPFTFGGVMVSEFAPPAQRGAALGMWVAVITLSGLVAPIVFGWIVEGLGGGPAGYRAALLVSSALVVVGGVLGAVLINPQREAKRFSAPEPPATATSVDRLPATTEGAA